MVDIITMCKLYDRQLYYYGNDMPKPDHKHNCFKEIELERIDRLDLVKIDVDKLRDYIDKFEHNTNKRAYLFMNRNTISCLETVHPSTICYSVEHSKTGIAAEFDCRKIFIDNDIEFGKVEIR